MLKYIEVTGKNEDDAIQRALQQLGMERDDVSVEILARAKTGFLGIGSVPAKVRVSYEGPDEPEEVPAPAPVKETPAPAKAPAAPKAAEQPAKQPAPEKKAEPEAKPAAAPKAAPAGEPCDDETSARITDFLTGLLRQMEVEATPVITRDGDTYSVVLEGEDLGSLIGRRGETLDAIQQLTGYAVNRGQSKRARIHVDAENYRARREESLERLAHKVAGKVVKYRRNVTLEAMNAYERHVIHAALQDEPYVTTYSTGTEPNRRTVVAYSPDKQ